MTSLNAFWGAYLLDFCCATYDGSMCPQGLLYDCPLSAPLPELGSFVRESARAFYSLGTCTNLNTAKVSFRIWTYSRYAAIWGSLTWYSPVTCPVTNRESLFASKLSPPISLASSITTIKASYSSLLLLALKANCRVCSINSPFGPSRMTPAPLPYCMEDLSTERTHLKSASNWCVPVEESSTTKSA